MRSILLCVVGLVACSPEPEPVAPAFRHSTFYEVMERDAASFAFADGDWREDYGDAPLYGLAYTSRRAVETGDVELLARSDAARARAVTMLETADLMLGDLNELTMSALGLIEYMDATGDQGDVEVLDGFIDDVDTLMAAMGWDFDDAVVESWAIEVYGPTAIRAAVGLLNAQYALMVGGPEREQRTEWAVQLASHVTADAHDGTAFGFGADRAGTFLYPNVMMVILDTRLYELTGEDRYRDRAIATFEAIGALKISVAPVRYHSPYSATMMGAQTGDYATLSSQNYLMFAAMQLYRITGDARYLLEVDGVLDALSTDTYGAWCRTDWHRGTCDPGCGVGEVCVDGLTCEPESCHTGVLHHWMDGAPAHPSHLEFVCTGCNLQTLYMMQVRQTLP